MSEDKPAYGRRRFTMADLSTGVWYEWQVGGDLSTLPGDHYRLCDLNGMPTLEQKIRGHWVAVRLPADADPLLMGIANLAKRLSNAEKFIDLMRNELGLKDFEKV